MTDFAVEYALLAEYGSAMGRITGEGAAVLRAARVDSPSTAMSGGLASAAAGMLQGRFEAATRRVGDHLATHPARLIDSAEAYREAEDKGVGLIRETFGGR